MRSKEWDGCGQKMGWMWSKLGWEWSLKNGDGCGQKNGMGAVKNGMDVVIKKRGGGMDVVVRFLSSASLMKLLCRCEQSRARDYEQRSTLNSKKKKKLEIKTLCAIPLLAADS